MFGFLFFIILTLIILVGVVYYINDKNIKNDNFLLRQIDNLKNVKQNLVKHLNNSLLEVDHLSTKYKYLGTSNSNSVCYKDKNTTIDNCECHPSCKTCGYSSKPDGVNQCLTCTNGTSVNQLYDNGAGWCSSFQVEESKTSTDSSSASSSASSAENESTEENDQENKVEECLNKFRIMCPTSSDWKECLLQNKQSLLLSGCQIQLTEDGTATASYSPVDAPSYSDSSNTDPNTDPPTATKNQLRKGEELNQGEHLVSSNTKHVLLIKKEGELVLKNIQTNQELVIFKLTTPAPNLAPYKFKIRPTNKLVFLNKDDELLWSADPKTVIEGPNAKLTVSDAKLALIFKDDNENLVWASDDSHNAADDTTADGAAASADGATASADGSAASADGTAASADGTAASADGAAAGNSQSGSPQEPYSFADLIFGVKKFSKCPDAYPFEAKGGGLGGGQACSKTDGVAVNRDNSCAMSGYHSGTALLPRCYSDQVGYNPNTNKYVRCPAETGYTGAPELNQYVMLQNSKNKILCKKRRGLTDQYRPGPSPEEVANFKDE